MNQEEENVARLLRGMRATADDPYLGAGPAQARRAAETRRRRRQGLAAVAGVVVVFALVGLALGVLRGQSTDRLHPVAPRPSSAPTAVSPSPSASSPTPTGSSPSPLGSSGAVTSLGQIDWRNSIMNLPTNDLCPDTRVQFTNGVASLPPWHYGIVPSAKPVYGDVNQDGFTDAVVVVTCYGTAEVGGPETRFLIVAFTGNAKGGPTPLGLVAGDHAYGDPLPSLQGAKVVVDWRPSSGISRVDTYRRTGTAFARS